MAIGEGWDIPAGLDGWSDFSWFKVAGGKCLTLVVLSPTPLWYIGHFHKKRMHPCLGEGCALCASEVGGQVRYVFAAMERGTHKIGLMEVGKSIANQLRDAALSRGEFRGMVIELSKYSYAKNSRMELTVLWNIEPTGIDAIEVPDIPEALRATWEKLGVEIPEKFQEIKKPQPLDVRKKSNKRPPADFRGISGESKAKAEGL
jgi:hypothetical protein